MTEVLACMHLNSVMTALPFVPGMNMPDTTNASSAVAAAAKPEPKCCSKPDTWLSL